MSFRKVSAGNENPLCKDPLTNDAYAYEYHNEDVGPEAPRRGSGMLFSASGCPPYAQNWDEDRHHRNLHWNPSAASVVLAVVRHSRFPGNAALQDEDCDSNAGQQRTRTNKTKIFGIFLLNRSSSALKPSSLESPATSGGAPSVPTGLHCLCSYD